MDHQERIPKIIYELTLRSRKPAPRDLAKGVLTTLGWPDHTLSEGQGKNYFELKVFSEEQKQIKQLDALFKRLKIASLTMRLKVLRPADWLTLWKKTWRPAPLTKTIDVVPCWYQDKYRPKQGRDHILMDTLLSFGTGLHETTRIMAQFIENNAGNFKSFLDSLSI